MDTNYDTLKERLLSRQAELSEIVLGYVTEHEGQKTADSFREVADLGEQSVDDLINEIDIAHISQEVKELKEINAAITRLNQGEFGTCVDCGESIASKRLEVNPAVARCIKCQTEYEHRHGVEELTPSL
ncbi:TraR/DksA family transcriptional regulator [Kaarinaea lacus]